MGARITIAHDRTSGCRTVRPDVTGPVAAPDAEILHSPEKKRQTVTPLHFVRIAVKNKTHTPQLCNLSSCLYHGSSLLRFRKDSISMSTLQAFKTLMAVPQ